MHLLACAGTAAAAIALCTPSRAQSPAGSESGAAPAAVAVSIEQAKPALPPGTVPRPAFACRAPAEFAHFNYALRRSARQLANGETLTIVAIGSSSTFGAGASSPAASYPSRLAVELRRRLRDADITVLNRGVNGDETQGMIARFERDVIAAHPDLVLWQIGTNSVLRDHPVRPHSAQLREGIARLKNAGADVVLIDMQFAPRVLAKSETQEMEDQIALTAKEEGVDLFRRFALMRNWHEEQHIPFEAFVSPDELHMNDWSYACVAKLLADAIAEAATRPVATTAVHTSR